MHDVGIIGAGPAGLNAALLLGRCRRDVIVFDSGRPRNAVSRGLHGFLTRDGLPPMQLREIGRKELQAYPSVQMRDLMVVDVRRRNDGFELVTNDGATIAARMVLLATGRDDVLPRQPGFRELYGRGVYHCPFCDGWEHRDRAFVAHGQGASALELALTLLTWTRDVTLCTDGPSELSDAERRQLDAHGVGLLETRILELRGESAGTIERVRFEDGSELECQALFFQTPCPQKSGLPAKLGCSFDENGSVVCKGHAATGIPGLFVAGNVRRGLHLAIMAAAEGAEAAVAINEALRNATG